MRWIPVGRGAVCKTADSGFDSRPMLHTRHTLQSYNNEIIDDCKLSSVAIGISSLYDRVPRNEDCKETLY